MRVQVAKDRYYYPDVTVSCDENKAENALNAPRVVFEVPSPSTEAIDRTEKLEVYCGLPSVEDYVLVSPGRQAVEVHAYAEQHRHHFPRNLLPFFEVHQRRDGSFSIPEALRPYMGRQECIRPKNRLVSALQSSRDPPVEIGWSLPQTRNCDLLVR